MRKGYLQRDIAERFNTKRGWFRTAWRIVDGKGKDMIQPWFNHKREAFENAKACDIELIDLAKLCKDLRIEDGEQVCCADETGCLYNDGHNGCGKGQE